MSRKKDYRYDQLLSDPSLVATASTDSLDKATKLIWDEKNRQSTTAREDAKAAAAYTRASQVLVQVQNELNRRCSAGGLCGGLYSTDLIGHPPRVDVKRASYYSLRNALVDLKPWAAQAYESLQKQAFTTDEEKQRVQDLQDAVGAIEAELAVRDARKEEQRKLAAAAKKQKMAAFVI